mmetsp:Transcript_118110/g.252403  ORF Transcript_118110/g.252403 Transcript_118110/m.252403 type:complete len:220 (-) Transcript_118110:515-1174(-)
MPYAHARRNDLLTPHEVGTVEVEEPGSEVGQTQLALAGPHETFLHLLLHVRLLPVFFLERRGGQTRQHHIWVDLHEVDHHESEGVRRQIPLRGTTNLRSSSPELHGDAQVPHSRINFRIGLQKSSVLEGLSVLVREVDVKIIVEPTLQDWYFGAKDLLLHRKEAMLPEQRAQPLQEEGGGVLWLLRLLTVRRGRVFADDGGVYVREACAEATFHAPKEP